MEIKVKLRLPDADSHCKLRSLLALFHIEKHHQLNTFFDGAEAELSLQRAVLRIRFYEDTETPKCVVSLKAKVVLVDGVSRVEQDEEDLDPKTGYECVNDPRKLIEVDSIIIRRVKQEFHIGEGGLVWLGGFGNVRHVYEWKGVKLEVDETMYDFGTLYEIECESTKPDKVKGMIEEFLKENGIGYSYSQKSKFATFREGKLPQEFVGFRRAGAIFSFSFLPLWVRLASTEGINEGDYFDVGISSGRLGRGCVSGFSNEEAELFSRKDRARGCEARTLVGGFHGHPWQ